MLTPHQHYTELLLYRLNEMCFQIKSHSVHAGVVVQQLWRSYQLEANKGSRIISPLIISGEQRGQTKLSVSESISRYLRVQVTYHGL